MTKDIKQMEFYRILENLHKLVHISDLSDKKAAFNSLEEKDQKIIHKIYHRLLEEKFRDLTRK